MKRLGHEQRSIHLGLLDGFTAASGIALGKHADQSVKNVGQPFTVPVDRELRTQHRGRKSYLGKGEVVSSILTGSTTKSL
ncbi:MAG TPA: hypothetical protein VKG24_25340 [Pseudolabrys sp.]|nr:hypothetical protein [Pseudolabrys sp.]